MRCSYTTDLVLTVNGHEACHEATVSYEYERACGDGWNEPREPEHCTVESVEVLGDGGKVFDVYPLLSAQCVMGLAADCLQYERECRQPDPDMLRELREGALL